MNVEMILSKKIDGIGSNVGRCRGWPPCLPYEGNHRGIAPTENGLH